MDANVTMLVGYSAIILVSFLLGSIPWGVVISRLFYHTDLRTHGSGNIGTTNAMRTLGKVGGGAVFVLDFAKGLAASYIAWYIGAVLVASVGGAGVEVAGGVGGAGVGGGGVGTGVLAGALGGGGGLQGIAVALAMLASVCGHVFSPWLRFKGGKGIAVAAGSLPLAFGWVGMLLELALFVIWVVATRYVSVGSIAAAVVCMPIAAVVFWGNPVAIVLCCAVAALIIWAHRENISRLRKGTENRIGSKKQTKGQ